MNAGFSFWGDTPGIVLTVRGEVLSFGSYNTSKLPPIAAVALGYMHALFLSVNGELFSTGQNSDGQLGFVVENTKNEDGGVFTVQFPESAGKPISIAAGAHHSIAMMEDGYVYSWGWADSGRLGHGNNNAQPTPKKIEFFAQDSVYAIAGGSAHTAIVTKDGKLYMWGWGNKGRLGLGNSKTIINPTQICSHQKNNNIFNKVHTIVSDSGYRSNDDEEHTLERDEMYSAVMKFPGKPLEESKVVAVALGGAHTLVLTDEGDVWTFGDNSNNQLAIQWTVPSPIYVRQPAPSEGQSSIPLLFLPGTFGGAVVGIAAGESHSLALTDEGYVYSWGAHRNMKILGQGDNKEFTSQNTGKPTRIPSLKNVISITAGKYMSVAITASKEAYIWGTDSPGIPRRIKYSQVVKIPYKHSNEELHINEEEPTESEEDDYHCFMPLISHLNIPSPAGIGEASVRANWRKLRELWVAALRDNNSAFRKLPRDLVNAIQEKIITA